MGLGNITFGGNNVRFGNDADKPVSPNPGDEYIALDTRKKYVCYENNIWKSVFDSSQIYKDVQRLDKQVWNTAVEMDKWVLTNCLASVNNGTIIPEINSTAATMSGVLENSSSSVKGMKFKTLSDMPGIILGMVTTCTLRLYDSSHTLIETSTVTATAGTDVLYMYPFQANTIYYLERVETTAIPHSNGSAVYNNSADIEILAERYNNYEISGDYALFDSMKPVTNKIKNLTGSAVSPLVSPVNIQKWEYIYFDTLDTDNILSVDILDSSDGVLISGVHDGDSINSIPNDTDIKIKFNYSASSDTEYFEIHNAILNWINVLS